MFLNTSFEGFAQIIAFINAKSEKQTIPRQKCLDAKEVL